MKRRSQRSTRTDTSFPSRRSSVLATERGQPRLHARDRGLPAVADPQEDRDLALARHYSALRIRRREVREARPHERHGEPLQPLELAIDDAALLLGRFAHDLAESRGLGPLQIGRASCRERGGSSVWISVVAGSLTKKKQRKYKISI